MPDFAVTTIFNAKDKVTGIFKRMSKAADKFGTKSDKAFNRASKSASKFGSITKGILAAGAVQKGIGLLTMGVQGVVTEFIEFDDAIVGAGARFKDIGPDSKNFAKDLLLIKTAAREAGAATEFTATQGAKALDFLAKAGFTSAEAMGSLNSMINLATATGEDFATVADMSSDLLGAFGLSVEDPIQKIKNLNRLNDVLVKTTNSANVTVENMFETMKQIGPIAKGVLGASLEEVSALTAILGNSGIKASDAMTALKNAYLRLAAPVGDGAKLLKSLNITLDDGSGGAKKMTDLMSELGGKLKGLGEVKQAKALDLIFGKMAIAGGKNIIDNISNIKKFEKTLFSAAGTSQKTADLMRQSLGNRIKTLVSSLTELGFKFLDAFKSDGVGGLEALTKAVRAFDMKPVIEGVKTLATTFQTFYNFIRPALPIFGSLLKLFIAYTVATKAWAVAQGILNAVMIANPFVAVAKGIIIAGFLMIDNWDLVKSTFVTVVSGIGEGINKLWGWFSGFLDNPFFAAISTLFLPFITIPALIMKSWEPLKEFFSGIFDKMSVVSKIGSFFGIGGDEEKAPATPVTAPNQTEINSKSQIGFQGKLQIAGAPEGSTIESKTIGAPPIRTEMLGENI